RPVMPFMMMPSWRVLTGAPSRYHGAAEFRFGDRRVADTVSARRELAKSLVGRRKRTPAGRIRGPVKPDARGGGIVIRHVNNDLPSASVPGRVKKILSAVSAVSSLRSHRNHVTFAPQRKFRLFQLDRAVDLERKPYAFDLHRGLGRERFAPFESA